MSMPLVTVFKTLYADITLEGPGVTTWDFDNYTEARFVCTALGIDKSTSDAAEAELASSGANLTVHFLPSDFTGKTNGTYPYQVQVRPASPAAAWRDVGGVGMLCLRDAA